jgi:hypothetical protein
MEPTKNALNDIIENVAGLVWLSLFMDGTEKCKILSTSPSTHGLSKIHHLNTKNGKNLRCLHRNLQFDTFVPFHDKQRIATKYKNVQALNERMGGTEQNRNLKEDQRLFMKPQRPFLICYYNNRSPNLRS